MGFLNLAFPILSWLDQELLGFLPPWVRLMIWSAAGALLAMELYRLLSPQKRITTIKRDFQEAQSELNAYDGPFEGAWPRIGRVLGLALKRIGLVLPATLAASLPLLMVILWLEATYAHRFPAPEEPTAVEVSAPGYEGRLLQSPDSAPRAAVTDDEGSLVLDVVMDAPVPLLHKWRPWNLLLGNPAGYLPDDGPVDRLVLDLPRLEVLSLGPSWLRGWEPVFFVSLLVFAFLLKKVRRIE